MQHSRGPEYFELGRTLSRSRSTSMSSDSQLPRIHLLTPPPVNPPPSFIAPSAASQIITADQEFNTADFVAADDNDGASASAIVTPQALTALNGFLDHLLFNILATAKSTQLTSIRPALAEVLKPRLAKEVVTAADEELSEYMGGPEDEEVEFGGSLSQSGEFDLIRSWKLTRLRCMVYTRLGDMEEDDEEEYIAQDGLADDEGVSRRFSSHVGTITPAAAIFITSIIEHIGEQALVIAGETARSRLAKAGNNPDADADTERATMDRLVVEDLDMEKLALNPTLGRLWRTWRKRIRNPTLTRAVSRESVYRRGTIGAFSLSQKSSINAIDELLSSAGGTPATETPPTELDPASVPLPVSDHDIEEIENPAFAHDMDGGEVVQTMEAVVAHKVRPHSLMVLTLPSPRSPTSGGNSPSPITPNSASSSKPVRHARSRSLPNASYDQQAPQDEKAPESEPSPTAEERKKLETMYEHEEDNVHVVEPKTVAINPAVKLDHADFSRNEESAKGSPEMSLETTATSSTSAASMEAVTSQTSSTHGSTSSLSDRVHTDTDVEILEGQGMAEKPKLTTTTVQRPKRKSSRLAPNVDCSPQAVPEDESPRPGVSAPVRPAVQSEVVQVPDADTATESQAPHALPSTVNTQLENNHRPVSTSGEGGHTEQLRPRSRPSPLPLTTSASPSQHGVSSPGLSSASSATERAGVQRLSGKLPPSATSSSFPKSRRSDSFSSNREKRPVTAGSATSQVSSKLKGLISRPAESGSLRLRSSSETSRASAYTGDSVRDDKSGLDELIRSEETIHYTLTPKSMREMENPDSPRWRTQRSSTADLADFLKNTAPPGEATRPRTKGNTGPKSPEKPKHTPIQIAAVNTQQNPNAGHTRDTKASVGSTRDFAKFVKSSGGAAAPPTSGQNGSAKTSRFRRFSDAAELSKKFTRPASGVSNPPRSNGPRPQARPAAIPREDSADLIDFIREGPPTPGARRIPRTVAPFRDTMDSDDLDSLEPASTVASTHEGSMATKSTGSRTGLLESTNRTTVQASGPVPTSNPPPVGTSNDPFPVRKQSRVPDPYAIDMDDDLDDDELEELLETPKPKREEESLMDFLRNVPPPASEAPPQPFSVNMPAAKGSSGGFGGASSIKARLLRNTSAEKPPSAKPSRSSLRQQQQQQPEGYGTTTSNYTWKTSSERPAGTLRTSPSMPSVSERQTETSALADFLRNTGPPEPPMPVRQTSAAGGKMLDSNNISRLFTRRKKVEV
ncbi:hypothetical protein ATEIFO6365_0006043200 [Aspergillus terreus]|uniref:Uncharacterized protein n=1 Tax=Aspergillus terreus TaxID=33178 RepID=A0A5M3Z1I2_ASPTE|nr:hypothetical protein ATETN484_0005043000 [Aspergillus terreus]GFF17095.1 hypothetical protein ATEIFO6365_0006043200 [Aspergillus terreus]